MRYQVKYGADVIKFCASGGVLSLADEVDTPQLTLEEMTALCDEAHRLRKKVACHSHGDQAARDAVLAGVNSIEHGSFLSTDTLKLMKERGHVPDPHADGARLDHAEPGQVPARDRRQGRGGQRSRFRRRSPRRSGSA